MLYYFFNRLTTIRIDNVMLTITTGPYCKCAKCIARRNHSVVPTTVQ